MDVAAKKQMNLSSYCWSPVTVGMISYSGEWECGLFCKFTEAFPLRFLEKNLYICPHICPCKGALFQATGEFFATESCFISEIGQ